MTHTPLLSMLGNYVPRRDPSIARKESRDFQLAVKAYLEGLLRENGEEVEVQDEWPSMEVEDDLYSPRVDVAAGPFSNPGQKRGSEYDRLMQKMGTLIPNCVANFTENAARFGLWEQVPSLRILRTTNYNSRCLIAIEIERSGTRKHMLGDLLNAGSLGRIGLVIGWDEDTVEAFVHIMNYFKFLTWKEKPSYEAGNVLVVSKEQFLSTMAMVKQGSVT